MKTQLPDIPTNKASQKQAGKFASEAAFLAEKARQFQAVFGKVDLEKAKRDGLIS